MKKSFMLVSMFSSLIFGCSSLPKDLANDPAEIDLIVNSPWGNQQLHRRMPTNYQHIVYVTNYYPVSIQPVK